MANQKFLTQHGIISDGVIQINDFGTKAVFSITPRSSAPTGGAVNDIYLDDGTNTGNAIPGFRRLVSTGPDVWQDLSVDPDAVYVNVNNTFTVEQTITIADTVNEDCLTLNQNDVTNNGDALIINNTGTGNSINVNSGEFAIEGDGTLSVSGVTDYETLVTADDDIPNKKYVDDYISTNFGNDDYYVNSTVSVASPDGSFNKPYSSLQACMTAIGAPSDAADALRKITVHIKAGQYDENVAIPQQRMITLLCYGTVVIGDGAADNLYNSTVARNLTVQNTATGEPVGAPSRTMFAIKGVSSEVTSTHSAYGAGNIIISGDLQFNHIDGNTTSHESYLSGVKVQGDVTANANELGSVHNTVIEKCFFDNTLNLSNVNINVCRSTEFDGLITANGFGRFEGCEIDGGITGAMVDYYPPNGFFNCDVGSGTWTITNALVNDVTRQQLVDNSISVTGGYVLLSQVAFKDTTNTFIAEQTITIADTTNSEALTINQNDTTNNPDAALINNTGSGNSLNINSGEFLVEGDGTLSVAAALNYETLVTADDDIPNKKYVDDEISAVMPAASNVDIDTGTEVVDSFPDTTTGSGIVWHYVVEDNDAVANRKTGTIQAIWEATTNAINHNEYGVVELGDASDVTFNVDIDSDNVRLTATTTSDNWTVRVKRVII
jgi:hypothetical protein